MKATNKNNQLKGTEMNITIKTEVGMGGVNCYVAYAGRAGRQVDFENFYRDDDDSADRAWARLNERLETLTERD